VAIAALAGLLYHAEVYCERVGRATIPIEAVGFLHYGFRPKKLWPPKVFPDLEAYRGAGLSVAQILARNKAISQYAWIDMLRKGRDAGHIPCSSVSAMLEVMCL